MLHHPSPVASSVAPYAVALAGRALAAGKLVIYAGAGISLSPPTGLPTGAKLAEEIHARLKVAFPILGAVESGDLVAVADALAALPGGEDALRQASLAAANFKTAKPGYAHRTLAHLMLEGVIDVLTTNWDNCIERGSGEERLQTVTTPHDLVGVTPPWVLKVHGCASRPDSLLVTSEQLDTPPTWVQEQTHARLGSAVVVFLGIGDVADYVRRRVEDAIMHVGSLDNIRVVSPKIESNWEESQWNEVAPSLRPEYKISATADDFMEHLAAAYIMARFDEHSIGLLGSDLANDFDEARAGLLQSDSLTVLQWARSLDINPRAGEAVLKSPELGKVLVALGRFAGNTARLRHDHVIDTDNGLVEVLVATQTASARRLVEAAENRLHEHAHRGEGHPLFLVAGGVGSLVKPVSLPRDIVSDLDDADIVDGPSALIPNIMHADAVIAS